MVLKAPEAPFFGILGVKKGVLFGFYLWCLGRSRGERGVLVGSHLRCLGRLGGIRCLRLLGAMGSYL